jgi:hypothetical protein
MSGLEAKVSVPAAAIRLSTISGEAAAPPRRVKSGNAYPAKALGGPWVRSASTTEIAGSVSEASRARPEAVRPLGRMR